MFHAASSGHEAVIKLLLFQKVNVNARDSPRGTPLFYVAENGNKAVMKLLLDTNQVDINVEDKEGHTPVLRAALGGHVAVVKMLFDTDKVGGRYKPVGHTMPLIPSLRERMFEDALARSYHRYDTYRENRDHSYGRRSMCDIKY